jgi:hypothetical protein
VSARRAVPALLLFALAQAVPASRSLAEPAQLPDPVVTALRDRIAGQLMTPGRCVETERAGWEGVPLVRCDYEEGGLRASVVLANATPERMARWMVSACVHIGAPDIAGCAERLRAHVRRSSDYQFPVAGIVLEDIDPDEPGFEVYAFRNGVTVRVAGVESGRHFQPTPAQLAAALDGDVTEAMVFARIASTTREEYRKAGGTDDVGTSAPGKRKAAWVDTVGRLWRAALTDDDNALLLAWATAHRTKLCE